MLPQENFVKLDTRRSLLKPFLGSKTCMFKQAACEIAITDCE